MTETFVTLVIAVIAAIVYARMHKDSREFTKLMTALVIGMIVGIMAFNIGLTIKKATSKNNVTNVTNLISTNSISHSPVVLSDAITNYYLSQSNNNKIDHFVINEVKLVTSNVYLWKPTNARNDPEIINDS